MDEGPPKEKLPILFSLRQALNNKNMELLRTLINAIQEGVERDSQVKCSPMSESELTRLMKTGEGEIYVGTGTIGQRIFITNGKMWMFVNSALDREYTKKYQDNFRYLFEIPDGEEPKVTF